MSSTPVLDALPLHRQLDLLARPNQGREALEAQLHARLDAYGASCARPPEQRGHLPTLAILGGDGLWHLQLGAVMICSGRYRPEPAPHSSALEPLDGTAIRHEPWFAFRDARPVWDVRLTSEHQHPQHVPPGLRCPVRSEDGDWDPYRSPVRSNWKSRKRSRYIDAAGRMCHACGESLGQDLEYDRYTELIRGVLCQYCSGAVYECPHPDGCYRADYLNHPPAGHLRERYYTGGNRNDRPRLRGAAA
ncbi:MULTISPECIES: hypothetical protein [Streptomyces]|uniref:hypothetical protein n=1 Tax=Streptomyces TaxID=1883 RepID=UPI0011121543|nr:MULTISPECIES: hypothetical protein [Streptomyces]MDT9701622.1 hypothetical protein [Streptomyces sp. P17]